MTVPSYVDPLRVALVCVRNAGRSQMAHAFAGRERDHRGAGDRVELVTGGTDPGDRVRPLVVETTAEVGIGLAGRTPRRVPGVDARV